MTPFRLVALLSLVAVALLLPHRDIQGAALAGALLIGTVVTARRVAPSPVRSR